MGDLADIKQELSSIPWCQRLLADTSHEAARRLSSDLMGLNGQGGTLFAQTFCTEDTIPVYLMLYRPPCQEATLIDEIKCILKLKSGLNGFPDTCHGGAITAILDEVMGGLIPLNITHKRIPVASYMTVYLNTRYLKPVRTPSTVLVVAKLTKHEDKKLYIEGTIEDGEGTVLARGESFFLGVRRSKL